MKAVWYLLFACLINLSSQSVNPPELKLAFDYEAIETLKYTAIQPLFENYTKDLFINQTFHISVGNKITIEIGNISVSNITLDWENTHFLIPDEFHNPSIRIKNFSAFIMFDARAGNKIVHIKGMNSTLDIVNLDFEIGFGFGAYPNETIYAFIDKESAKYERFDLNLTSTFVEIIIWISDYFQFPKEEFASFLLKEAFKKINATVVEKSTNGLSVEALGLDMKLTMAYQPFIFYLSQKPHQAFSVNIEVKNPKSNSSAPVSPADLMPDFIDNDFQVQFFVSENLIQQVFWSAFDVGLINLNLSNADIPKSVPISLNTSEITILLPDIIKDFGPNKGMYLQIQAGNESPLTFIRDGRLLVEVDVRLNFWVDNNGSQYPAQGLINCTTCVQAVSLETKALASLVLYQINATNIGVRLINAQIISMSVISGHVDPENLSSTLNNLLVTMLLQLNLQLNPGIANPLIGKFGVNDMATAIITDYLLLELSVEAQQLYKILEI